MNGAQLSYDITLGTPYLPDFMYLPHGPLQTLICDQKWEIIWHFWKSEKQLSFPFFSPSKVL
jgi:hypothetical protein